eukprot:TRINITY_DN36039_c0_g1_i1.p1 TRINITY_DN36039_c0_g1~~TRINITY_DN36039_c0_g1_i1.p1  ORF type:complete len:313 (+),score=97.68 TRINITY_DN36039_c0_g1_i1:27-941(+)
MCIRDSPQTSQTQQVQAQHMSEYDRHLLRARSEQDWGDMLAMNALRVAHTGASLAVVMIAGCRVNTAKVDMMRVLLHAIGALHAVVDQPYVLVYSHEHATAHNQPDFTWMIEAQKILDQRYTANLTQLIVLDPRGRFIKAALRALKPHVSQAFWKKVKYIESSDQLRSALKLQPAELAFFAPPDPNAQVNTAAIALQRLARAWLAREHVKRLRQSQEGSTAQLVISFTLQPEPAGQLSTHQHAELLSELAIELCLDRKQLLLCPADQDQPSPAPLALQLWPTAELEQTARDLSLIHISEPTRPY